MKPKFSISENSDDLKKAAQEYIDFIFSNEYHEDRAIKYENGILEEALIFCFGPGIFNIINDRMEIKKETV